MAKQSFVTGQVLTAQQVNDLQTNDFNQTVSAKTASYTLVAADKGTRITMSSTSATTITVNTGLFAAGDTLFIQNLNTGVATITAGTATVDTSASLALAQHEGGTLYFTSAGASTFFKAAGAAGASGKVLQVVSATTTTATTNTTTTLADTTLTATITPSAATSKILVLTQQYIATSRSSAYFGIVEGALLRGATKIVDYSSIAGSYLIYFEAQGASSGAVRLIQNYSYLDSPSTTSATTYKTQLCIDQATASATVTSQENSNLSSIILMEIGA